MTISGFGMSGRIARDRCAPAFVSVLYWVFILDISNFDA